MLLLLLLLVTGDAPGDSSSERLSMSSVRITSSMDKTPSGDKDDELCYSEDMNVTDDDDKGDGSMTGVANAALRMQRSRLNI